MLMSDIVLFLHIFVNFLPNFTIFEMIFPAIITYNASS